MKKKYLSILLIALVTLSTLAIFSVRGAEVATVVSITPSIITGQSIGSTFTVAVHVDNAQALWQWLFNVSWNPTVLQMSSAATDEGFLGGGVLFLTPPIDNTMGQLGETSCSRFQLTGVSGSGDLSILTFTIVGYGSSDITFTALGLYGMNGTTFERYTLDFASTGAAFNLPSPNSTPTPTPTPVPTSTASPTPTPTSIQTPTPTPTSSPSPSGTAYPPISNFVPLDGTTYSKGEIVILDASGSQAGYDSAGKNESCPITNYAWRVEYSNGTLFKSFSNKICNFTVQSTDDLRIILIVTANDPTPPSAPAYSNAASKTAIIHVIEPGSGGVIDVYLDNGGKGQNSISGPYGPQQLITMFANVTYRGASVANKDVIFTVYNTNHTVVAIRSGRTDSGGIATAQFRLPWQDPNPENAFGNWSVFASVDISGVTFNDTAPFNYNYILTIKAVQAPSTTHRSDNFSLNITLNSISSKPVTTTTTITIYDSQLVPIGTYVIANATAATGNTALTQAVTIPSWAYLGQTTVYVNALTNSPDNGGLPYCREFITSFSIQ